MAEHGRDEADIDAVLQHERRHGVAEEMAGPALADAGGVNVEAHDLGQPKRVYGGAARGQEERAIIGAAERRSRRLTRCRTDPPDGPKPAPANNLSAAAMTR